MSTRVLIIPEDFRKDQHILRPLIKALFTALGRPNTQVEICMDPLLTGIAQAMDKDHLAEIFEKYGMVDLFLLCVDRDCDKERKASLNEKEIWARTTHGRTLIAENVWQELEVWVLAGHDLPPEWEWATIRAECDPKETYFTPFAEQRQVLETPGEGRRILAQQAVRRYERIRQLCPEDIAALEERVQRWLQEQ